jgi:hypothetical protein
MVVHGAVSTLDRTQTVTTAVDSRRLSLVADRALRYDDDPEMFDGCFSRRRDSTDRAGDEFRARAVLAAYGVAWDLRLRRKTALLRGCDPYGVVRQAIHRQAARYVKRNFPAVYAAQLRAREEGGLAGAFQFARLWEISQLVDHFRIETCVEFGSGASSAMFAELLGGADRFHTYEENKVWYRRLAAVLGELGRRCTAHHVSARIDLGEAEPVVGYDVEFDHEVDLVYVDGPSNTPPDSLPDEAKRQAKLYDPIASALPCVDVERMWRRGLYPRVVAVDGRRSTIRRLEATGRDRYTLQLCSAFEAVCHGGVPDRYLYHSIFVRK